MNTKVDEGKLISGKEAYRLIGDGVEIEAYVELKENLWQWEDAKHLPACDILNDGFDFRLKPHTITINGIEVPAPFEPKEEDQYWYLDSNDPQGYNTDIKNHEEMFSQFKKTAFCQIGLWRTEEEVKQVVSALRQVFGGSHDN